MASQIKQMEVEIRSHDAATRKVLGEKVTQYKRSLQSLKSDFESAREQAQRSQLMTRGDEQRQRFIATNDK
jgi:vesicle transport through interaction with t-SNAREs protein 1